MGICINMFLTEFCGLIYFLIKKTIIISENYEYFMVEIGLEIIFYVHVKHLIPKYRENDCGVFLLLWDSNSKFVGFYF